MRTLPLGLRGRPGRMCQRSGTLKPARTARETVGESAAAAVAAVAVAVIWGANFVVIDAVGPMPGLPGFYLPGRPKYFKGPERPRLGDLAYTEAALFGM